MEDYAIALLGLVVFLATALISVAIAFYCYYRSKRNNVISSERIGLPKVCDECPSFSSSLKPPEATEDVTEARKKNVKALPPTSSKNDKTDKNVPNETLQHSESKLLSSEIPANKFSQDVRTKAWQKIPNLLTHKRRPLEKKPKPIAPQKLPVNDRVPQRSLPQDPSPFTMELKNALENTRQAPNTLTCAREQQDSSSGSDDNTDTETGGETSLLKREASYVNVTKKSSPYVNANVPDDHPRIQMQASEEHLYEIFEENWKKDEKENSKHYTNNDVPDDGQSSSGSEEHVYESFDENWQKDEKKDSPLYISPINTDTEENDYPTSKVTKGSDTIGWVRV